MYLSRQNLYHTGFSPAMFVWGEGGPKGVRGLGALPQEKKICIRKKKLVLKMAYFN